MPARNKQVKRETKVIAKSLSFGNGVTKLLPIFRKANGEGRLKATESTGYGRPKHATDASQVSSLCVDQSRREKLPFEYSASPKYSNETDGVTCHFSAYVPVVSASGEPLMPCHPARARELVLKGKAIRRFKCGIFYIRLIKRESGRVQKVVCGIDTGSKREAFTVKDSKKDYINVLSDAVTTVKDKLETRRMMRKTRRNRKTPYRKCRYNRKRRPFPPSTKARWDAKLRIINILRSLYPICTYIVEDIKARTKKGEKEKWNATFSPLEHGKNYFYSEVKEFGRLALKAGYETAELRKTLSLEKTKEKFLETFNAHNVDSWVLAYSETGGSATPTNKSLLRLIPLNFHRRQLHALQPGKHGERRPYGGTRSLGVTRGTVIKHPKYGMAYVGGNSKDRISIHDMQTGERLSRDIRVKDIERLYIIKWRFLCF